MPTTPVRASPPAKLHGRHLVASNPFVSCTTLAMGAEGLCPRFPPNANLCRLLILPSGEWSRAGIRYHSLVTLRCEFGVAKSRYDLYSPKAWSRMPCPSTTRRACAPAKYGCNFLPGCETLPQVLQRNGIEWWLYSYPGCSSPIRTKASGGVGPRRLWSLLPSG